MSRLKILAAGPSPQARANARGKLFEHLMTEVLANHGYEVNHTPNVNYAGMEIDIDGKAIVTSIPLYAECKCYDTPVTSPKLQEFFGKYMTRWFKDRRCQGIFVAIPGINSHALGFYRENCETNTECTVRLLEEQQVLDFMYHSGLVVRPEAIANSIDPVIGKPGDHTVLFTDKSCFVVQYIILPGSYVADAVMIFDAHGRPVTNHDIIEYITELYSEIRDFSIIQGDRLQLDIEPLAETRTEQIVEVRGSSACFEYQFPASPEHFVGRANGLNQIGILAHQILGKQIASRGVVFEGNSGWGKSSLVLAAVHQLTQDGHLAVAIDSRTASSSQFVLQALHYTLRTCGLIGDERSGISIESELITGFDGAVDALLKVGDQLEQRNKLLFIFFDQFENIFEMPDTILRVRDLFARVLDKQSNIVLGFSWKTDLIGYTNDFPYHIRDMISAGSQPVRLEPFSDTESNALVDRLREELRAPVRKDLRFFLSEFSQGYPWLLKKLCAHVKSQREQGVSQQHIADSLLNVEQLFLADLLGLSSVQEETLRKVARLAPVGVSEIGEEFDPEIVQSLVDARLMVRIGPKYDIYWDIFRDYLNAGVLPVQENYILHNTAGPVFKHTEALANAGGSMTVDEWRQRVGLTSKAFYTLIREMRLLGLATINDDTVALQLPEPVGGKTFEEAFREHLREKLRRNRLVSRLLAALEVEHALTIEQVGTLLRDNCPYISAAQNTWHLYARTFGGWMDVADLATYNNGAGTIEHYSPATTLRQRQILQGRSKSGVQMPLVQYNAVVEVGMKIVDAFDGPKRIDWQGVSPSMRSKALADLELLGLIRRRRHRLTVTRDLLTFVKDVESRQIMFAEKALALPCFATFVDILKAYKDVGRSHKEIANELKLKMNADWKQSTAEAHVKVMMNWARHVSLAPGVFEEGLRSAIGTTGKTTKISDAPPC